MGLLVHIPLLKQINQSNKKPSKEPNHAGSRFLQASTHPPPLAGMSVKQSLPADLVPTTAIRRLTNASTQPVIFQLSNHRTTRFIDGDVYIMDEGLVLEVFRRISRRSSKGYKKKKPRF